MGPDGPGTLSEAGAPFDGSFELDGGVRASVAKGLGHPESPMEMVTWVHVDETDTQAYLAKSVDGSTVTLSVRGQWGAGG